MYVAQLSRIITRSFSFSNCVTFWAANDRQARASRNGEEFLKVDASGQPWRFIDEVEDVASVRATESRVELTCQQREHQR